MAEENLPRSQVPDPQLAIMEAALERERQISRDATAQLTALAHREAQIAQSPRPIDPPIALGSGWTVDTTMAHLLALREADRRFYDERDRRYAEVNVEKEKALKIKETADLAALQLAREIQTYKDEKANELREQISAERGHYASKEDLAVVADKAAAAIKPIERDISEIRQALARGPEGLGSLQTRADFSQGAQIAERAVRARTLGLVAVGISLISAISFIVYIFASAHP